jgi:hypothetical protein
MSAPRQLLQAVRRGEFTLNGFCNRDLQRLSFAQPAATPHEARRRSAWVSRKLRLLRAHGLIYGVTGTHRYHLTKAGRAAITAILTALRSGHIDYLVGLGHREIVHVDGGGGAVSAARRRG